MYPKYEDLQNKIAVTTDSLTLISNFRRVLNAALCFFWGNLPASGADVSKLTWCVQVLRSPKEAFAAAMQSWRERCEKCVCLQGDYVDK